MSAGRISKRRKVFVVHGRSLRARDAMFEFLDALPKTSTEKVDYQRLKDGP